MNAASAPAPDLIIAGINMVPATPRPGQTVAFDVVVRNDGVADAGPFDVVLTDDADARQRLDDGLAAGADRTLRMGSLRTGPFQRIITVTATADAGDEVAESREDNNWRTLLAPIGPPPEPPTPPQPPPLPPIPPRPPTVLLSE